MTGPTTPDREGDGLAEVKPRYGAASLADVLPAALAALGVPGAVDVLGVASGALSGVRRIALILVDGLGHRLLPRLAPVAPLLADAVAGRVGHLDVLTTGFPSTTPTSLVSVGTGAPPGAHGVVGFTVNVPGTDDVVIHIAWHDDPDPLRWQPLDTQFARAAAAGVAVTVVNRPEFAGSGLTVAAYRGARYHAATTTDEIVAGVLAGLRAGERALVYGYTPHLDRWGHETGVGSPRWLSAAAGVDQLLLRIAERLPADAALLVTADHGMVNIPPTARFDVDTIPALRAGVRVVAGEPRVRYLHTHDGARDDVMGAWREILGPAAAVLPREQAVAAGWFGPVPEEHLARVGDVVVITRGRSAVVATRTEPLHAAELVGYHGSTTAAEMEIPLLVLRGGV